MLPEIWYLSYSRCRYNYYLTCLTAEQIFFPPNNGSVVEISVEVICSCMPAFALFARHYQPLFRSFFRSSTGAKTLSIFKRPPRSDAKNCPLTLGSRVDGRGHFITSNSMFGREPDWMQLREARNNGRLVGDDNKSSHERSRTLDRSYVEHIGMETHVRSENSQDLERGPPSQGIRVEIELTSTT